MKVISKKEAKEQGLRYYYTGIPCKNGHIDQRVTATSVCRECCRESGRSWYNKNKGDMAWKKKRIINNIKNRARSGGKEFNLTVDSVEWPTHCPVLGLELDYSGKDRWRQVSIDRTDSSKGYVKDNVVVMSMRANSLKQDVTLDEAHKLYYYLINALEK